MKLLYFTLWLLCTLTIFRQGKAQQIEMIAGANNSSLRGLSVVSDRIVWVSGSHGTVGRSLDGGKTWEWMKVSHFEERDFRDIEAFDARTAIIMAIAEPANILKTTDGGKTWKTVFTDSSQGMFLDAMEFWNDQSGIAIGDPVQGRFYIIRTFDGGDHWQPIAFDKLPQADSGEACFASSGTNVRALDRQQACFISGGSKSRLFIQDRKIQLPIIQGQSSTGANSVAVEDNHQLKGGKRIMVVGGDFKADSSSVQNACLSHDGGKTWIKPETPPHGYRSCVEYIGPDRLITCGTSGVDVSRDGGMHWQLISHQSFHVCRKAKKGKAVFLAGASGALGKLIW
jgi:photosystem II stability/assembly factor-like uncharacterized protein